MTADRHRQSTYRLKIILRAAARRQQERPATGELCGDAEYRRQTRGDRGGEGVSTLPIIGNSGRQCLRYEIKDIRAQRRMLPRSEKTEALFELRSPLQSHRFGMRQIVVLIGQRARILEQRY